MSKLLVIKFEGATDVPGGPAIGAGGGLGLTHETYLFLFSNGNPL
jgi:hypothetical protein